MVEFFGDVVIYECVVIEEQFEVFFECFVDRWY